MIVRQANLLDFLGAEDVVFSIPLFQRAYSWDVWQCEDLWDDVMRAAENDLPHFFGALLYRPAQAEEGCDGRRELSLVDGQQRVLTMYLLLAAFARTLESRGASLFGLDGEELRRRFLFSGTAAKVCARECDREAFNAVAQGAALERFEGRRAVANLRFFEEKMSEPGFDEMLLWHGLSQLAVVEVEFSDEDDVQAVFESFNSKGVTLVAADLVRNYVLMAEDVREQRRLYDEYWYPIQGLFGDDPGSLRLNGAIRAYTIVRSRGARALRDAEMFRAFKRYFTDGLTGSTEDLLDELFSFCMVWAENYRYHAVKAFRGANWAKLGRKTLVSHRERTPVSKESWDYYTRHFGVASTW